MSKSCSGVIASDARDDHAEPIMAGETSCQRTGTIFGIWRFPLTPNVQPERISLGEIDAITPTTSRKENRIAWVSQLWDLNIYRIAATGEGVPVKLIASTLRDQGAVYSSDGRIAFISDRSGSREIWLAKEDGSGQVRVTNMKGPWIDRLQWSPDGHQLAFDSSLSGHIGIFVLECNPGSMNCSEPRRLTWQDTSEAAPTWAPAWSPDGKFLYFASVRTGRLEVWKQSLLGGEIVQVTRDGADISRESPDGKWLFFSKPFVEAIFRQPLLKSGDQTSSIPELLVGPPYRVQPGGWALTRDEVIFIDRASRGESAVIRAYNPGTRTMRSILSLNEVFADRGDITLSVSPDQKWILYSQLDRSISNVIVAENR